MVIEHPSIAAIETASLLTWPALETESDGSWVRRAAGGYTKRANSVQCLDPNDGDNAPERIAAAADWFRARQLPPVFRITPLTAPAIVAALEAGGGLPFDQSDVLAMPLETGRFPVAPLVEFPRPTEAVWVRVQRALHDYDNAKLAALVGIVDKLEVPSRGIVVRNADGEPLASALVAVAGGIAITVNVVTAVAARRRGSGRMAMQGALAWATMNGARFAVVQVLAENAAAKALYQGLGFTRQYGYNYQAIGTA
ncbi:MAG: hypothetical protein JWR75_2148 [Devosia sp.]|nr:hypothetical protein [Devosia sp.]